MIERNNSLRWRNAAGAPSSTILGAAALYALTGVTARLIDEDVPSALVNLYSTGFAVLGSVVLALFLGGFSPFQSASDLIWIVAMGGFGGIAD
jgi:drug/metabolite transporter (DMT)-like permease